ncbi:MAG: cobalamin B12-binding domain-containing protein, partial [Bacillota bacterium]|nr:cobalamin B12-binding domain-containing protein [Bacillota bacterium]
MKVLLVRPRPHPETIGLQDVMICEPLELEYLGAALKTAGHEVVIIDMILEHKPLSFFVQQYKPDFVGLTAYIAHINVVKEYAAAVKAAAPACKVVVGGVHA